MTTLTPDQTDAVDPIDYIHDIMIRRGLKRRDLLSAFGSRAKASEVLNRKRNLSLTMIRALCFNHGFDADKLIGECQKKQDSEEQDALANLDAGTYVLVPVEDVETIWKWLREPDHADAFTMDDLLQWVNSRPGSAAFSIIAAAQEGK